MHVAAASRDRSATTSVVGLASTVLELWEVASVSMRLENCTVVFEVRSGGTGKALKTKRCRDVAVELQLSENDDTPILSVQSKPPIDVRLQSGFAVHQRFVHQGKFSLSSAGKEKNTSVMVQSPEPSAALQFVRLASQVRLTCEGNGGGDGGGYMKPQQVKRGLAHVAVNTSGSLRSPAPKVPPHRRATGADRVATAAKPAGVAQPKVSLSAEQKRALEAALNGKSVFFTGGAGSGKSFLLHQIRSKLPAASTAMTASTGAAACLIGGSTLHSFAGIGSGDDPIANLIDSASRPHNRHRWRSTKALIVDEISMLDAELWDKIEHVARAVRGNNQPFGGIQLILCGDFLQLPPVSRYGEARRRLCFEASSFQRCVDVKIVLGQVHHRSHIDPAHQTTKLQAER